MPEDLPESGHSVAYEGEGDAVIDPRATVVTSGFGGAKTHRSEDNDTSIANGARRIRMGSLLRGVVPMTSTYVGIND